MENGITGYNSVSPKPAYELPRPRTMKQTVNHVLCGMLVQICLFPRVLLTSFFDNALQSCRSSDIDSLFLGILASVW